MNVLLESEGPVTLRPEVAEAEGRRLLEFYLDDVLLARRVIYDEKDAAIGLGLVDRSIPVKAVAANMPDGDVVVLVTGVLARLNELDWPFSRPLAAFATADVDYPLGALRRGWQDRIHPEDLEAEARDMLALVADIPFKNPETEAVDDLISSLNRNDAD